MHVTLVHVRVKPEAVAAFIAATRANHEASILEAGNRRCNVQQDPANSCRLLLYEADAAAHQDTPRWGAEATPRHTGRA